MPKTTLAPTADRVLYEKSVYLRIHSLTLLRRAQRLRRESDQLRKAHASVVSSAQYVKAAEFFPISVSNPKS